MAVAAATRAEYATIQGHITRWKFSCYSYG